MIALRVRVILFTLLVLALCVSSCSKGDYPGKVEPLAFGDLSVDSSVFVYIAKDQHFFEANGLSVTLRSYDTGPAAIDALSKGHVSIAAMGEFPVVAKAFSRETLSIIGTTDKFDAFYIVCRRDRGIKKVSDIRGRTIGLVRGALPEFYLGRFLDLNGMNIRDVVEVNVSPAQWINAIAAGDVDAVVVSQSYLVQIRERLADRVMIWPVQSGQAGYGLLICNDEFVKQHPDVVKRFLKALNQAEQYLVQHATKAKAILKRQLKYDDAYVEALWPHHRFSMTLDQSLILAMEDEARWMMKNGLTTEKQVPNFANHIYLDGLKAVKPEAVNIVR